MKMVKRTKGNHGAARTDRQEMGETHKRLNALVHINLSWI